MSIKEFAHDQSARYQQINIFSIILYYVDDHKTLLMIKGYKRILSPLNGKFLFVPLAPN